MNEPTGSCLLCGLACEPEVTGLFSKGQFGICPRCRADAALVRAVRRMPVDAYLLRVAGGWQADAGIVPDIAEGDTLDAALKAAGLMEVKE